MADLVAELEEAGAVVDLPAPAATTRARLNDAAGSSGTAASSSVSASSERDTVVVGGVDLSTARVVAVHAPASVAVLPLGGSWSSGTTEFWMWIGAMLWCGPTLVLVMYRAIGVILYWAGVPGTELSL